MTIDDTRDERDERELRDLLARRAEVRGPEVDALRGFVAALPARRRRRPSFGLLAAAAGITVMLSVGVLLAGAPFGSSGAGPKPPNPAAFAGDPRLAVCNAKATDAEAIFELRHLADYAEQLPNAYPLIGLAADPAAPALVIVFKGPGTPEEGGATPGPSSHDLCLVVGADQASWQHVGVANVDTTGLLAFLPEPSATPIASADLPWVERCGGPEAGINRILHLPHGTDAMTLNSLFVPQAAMSDAPMTIIEYAGAHPFAPQGTPPPSGATFAPREPLKPGERDLCILSGADPATAKRTIVEWGTQFVVAPPPSVAPAESLPTSDDASPGATTMPDPSPASILRPQIVAADCAALGLGEGRCSAVVEQARAAMDLAWTKIAQVHLAKPTAVRELWIGVADVTFTLVDGSTRLAPTAGCYVTAADTDPACADHPALVLEMPFGDTSSYSDVPCGNSGDACPTPLPSIDPGAASVPLQIPSRDYALSVGHMEILVGQATIPNGVLSDARFALADPTTTAFAVDGAITLTLRPVDPAGKPFDNAYQHGWHEGSEVVTVYLEFDVLSMTSGATLEVRDLVVR